MKGFEPVIHRLSYFVDDVAGDLTKEGAFGGGYGFGLVEELVSVLWGEGDFILTAEQVCHQAETGILRQHSLRRHPLERLVLA